MNNRDIVMVAAGFLAGSIAAGVAGYIYLKSKYSPLHRLENEVNELEWRKRELEAEQKYTADVIKSQTEEHTKRIAMLQDQESRMGEKLKFMKYAKPEDLEHDEESLEALNEDLPEANGNYFEPSGKFVIAESNPRWDGPLTDEEQDDFDNCEGDQDMEHTVLDDIRRKRYMHSIDNNKFMYRIDDDEHDDRPDWFDTIHLDYYEGDDIFAEGMQIIDNIAGLIDMRILKTLSIEHSIWCRNEKMECDYEIIYHKGSWQNAIFHIPEEEAAPVRKFNQELADRLEE